MGDPLTIEAVLDGGLDALLNPAAARRKAGIRLPELVAERLDGGVEQATRSEWADRLVTEIWPAVREERGRRWDLGWAELTAGLALAVELLVGELPPGPHPEIKGTPAEDAWRSARTPYQRFVLLVDSSVHVRRVFSIPQRRDASIRVEDAIRWSVDGPPFRDRSHTLMLALLADDALQSQRVPVAATGELLADGETVGPVGSLAAKAQAWWQHCAEGLLVSAPHRDHDPQSWASLMTGFMPPRGKGTPQWIVGATLTEIANKLTTDDAAITAWDGTPLKRETVIEPRLSAGDSRPPERLAGDLLFDACWAAWRDAQRRGGRRGVLIKGSPGSGKSVLTMSLHGSFARGPLSPLGYGVRRAARDLAVDINCAPAPTWAGVLSVREPSRAGLFDALAESRRLVPILDGLDELQPAQLQAVSKWLRSGDGWWLATSRPVRVVGIDLPDAWDLRLDDLGQGDASKFLTALGREDLAETIWPSGSFGTRPLALEELTRTPLQLALLASVVDPDQDAAQLDLHELYERAFEGLLDHACRSRRLTVEDAGLVRRLLSTLVGELALAWLTSPTSRLIRTDVDEAFTNLEMGPLDQVRAMDALAFGYLLVPAGAGWEFGHRTIAEWAAAAALHRRVEAVLRPRPGDGECQCPRTRRAEAEVEALSAFLGDGVLIHHGRWSTLMRFYAAYLKEPLALVDRLLGPAHATTWRVPAEQRWKRNSQNDYRELRAATSSEIKESWAFVFDVVGACRWSRSLDGRESWALAVRRWLLAEPNVESYSSQHTFAELRAFAATVGEHLPWSLPDLIALAARTERQRQRLDADPLMLLPALPAIRAAALSDLLERGDRRQQLAVLEWHQEHGIEPAAPVLEKLARCIPDELAQAGRGRAARDDPQRRTPGQVDDDVAVLSRLEAAVWRGYLSHAGEPSWGVVRRRFAEWPAHLSDLLTQWFGKGHASDTMAYATDDCVRRRREVFAALLDRAAEVEARLTGHLAAVEDPADRAGVLGRVRYFFSDRDDRHLQRMVNSIATAQGWAEETGWNPRPIEKEETASTIRQSVVLLHRLRARVTSLVGACADRTRLEGVVGELWTLLPPEHAARREIVIALDGTDVVPLQVPAEEILKRHCSSRWRLDRMQWTADHVEQLRRLASSGTGRVRHEAICVLARAENRDQVAALVEHLPSDDEEFTALVYERLGSRRGTDDGTTPAVPDPSRLPIADRAAANTPGWRAELLAGLADRGNADVTMLLDVAVRHRVREALPLLVGRLGRDKWHDRRVIEAIGRLVGDRDEEAARAAVRSALRLGWPDGRDPRRPMPGIGEPDGVLAGATLGQFLQVEDLDVLAEGSVSALRHPSLAEAIRSLGPDAIERLLDLYHVAAGRVVEADAALDHESEAFNLLPKREPPELVEARRRRDALAETLVASVDSNSTTPKELVDILCRIAGEDVHHVYGVPGPLGSDFDEPGDMDWHSDQVNEGLVISAARALEKGIALHPDEWPELRRLFGHPSESLRKRAFEMCADRAAPHEVAELAIEALDGHVRENRTRWTGRTVELLLAGRGAGSVYIATPDTGRSLVAAVRARLTPAHKDVVRRLATHALPAFRRFAAHWAGELGAEDWVEFVLPMFEDGDASVVWAALGAIVVLAPSRLDAALTDLRGESWTTEHDTALFARLRPTRDAVDLFGHGRSEQPGLATHVGEATLLRLLARAADRTTTAGFEQEKEREASCFRGFPSLIETVLSDWPRPLPSEIVDLLRAWTGHPVPRVREVGRRQLAARGMLDAGVVERSLASQNPANRVSGAECAVRMSMEPFRSAALRVLRGALAESPNADDYRAIGIEPPTNGTSPGWTPRSELIGEVSELRRRVLWALQGATPAFAEAVALVAQRIPYDDVEACIEPEGQEIVDGVTSLIRRWGTDGAIAILGLMDSEEVEDDYSIVNAIREIAARGPAVAAAIRERAARGGAVSDALLQELSDDEFERDLAGLARWLREEVFPLGWPELASSP